MRKKSIALLLMLVFSLVSLVGCAKEQPQKETAEKNPPAAVKELKLATTTSTQDTGLLDVIIPQFEKAYGYKVKVIAVGSGQAMEMGKKGDVDVLLVHARKSEDEFVAAGYGVDRKDVMHNDFILIGPENDPAKIKGQTDTAKALAAIAQTQSTFVSRGDDSGTHKKELTLWEKAGIKPEGDWYKSVGKGMGDTFRMADEMKAYTLIDRGTYLALKDKYNLVIMVEKDTPLLNPYGVIAINPDKYPKTDYEGAKKFIDWITSAETQKTIGEFGKDKYGEPLFVPDAVPTAQ
ncbi:MAG: extracellular solute-binding protein [Syntrophomonadaceae bacterium]|jgi:tungstate transport system substrate-binding protein